MMIAIDFYIFHVQEKMSHTHTDVYIEGYWVLRRMLGFEVCGHLAQRGGEQPASDRALLCSPECPGGELIMFT